MCEASPIFLSSSKASKEKIIISSYDKSDKGDNNYITLLEKEENNTETYFNPLRYKSKFSWFNILYIIERMSYTRKLEYIPFLIELLQDANWPTFEYTVSLLVSYNKNDLLPYVERLLWRAYEDDDEMWISGIAILIEDKNIKKSDFENPKTYDLLKYRDFYRT